MPDFHILLVEDDENDIFFVERAIRDIRGLSLYVLRDGQEAIKYLRGDPPFDHRTKFPLPNLILLDLKMPKTGGFDVLNWKNSDTNFARIPVIVTSSSSLQIDIDLAYDLGANAYMVKPMTLQEMRHVFSVTAEFWKCISKWPSTPPASLARAQKTTQGQDKLGV